MSAAARAQSSVRTCERIALALIAAICLLSLVSRHVRWDWLFDTAYLAAAAFLVIRGDRELHDSSGQALGAAHSGTVALGVCTYLFVDSVLQLLVTLTFPSFLLLAYVCLAACYGLALLGRLRNAGIAPDRFEWARLFRGPSLPATLATLIPLFCMYLPMARVYQSFQAWSGPMVITLPGTIHMNPGRTLTFGNTYVVRGIQLSFSRCVLLLFAGAFLVRLLRIENLITEARSLLCLRIVGIAAAVWWLLIAKGYGSLDMPASLLFVSACAALLFLAFRSSSLV